MDRLEERHLYEWGNIHCQILISRGTPPWTMKNCQNWSSESRMVLDHVCCPRPKEAEIDLQGLWTPSMFCLATSINAYAMDTHTYIYIPLKSILYPTSFLQCVCALYCWPRDSPDIEIVDLFCCGKPFHVALLYFNFWDLGGEQQILRYIKWAITCNKMI